MAEPNKCPQCGTSLPSGALAGLCPACLLKAGASEDTVTDAKQGAFTPPSVPELAAKFPQLEILQLIGKGGMGAVYKARQRQLDRIVALKILPPGIGDDPAFAERFAREAKALAKLNHPNIVTLYEFGDAGGQFYFLMEFVDGVNLRQLLHAGRISPREALAIVPQICDALQFAHDQGIVHRDIKPENILLDRRGRVKVADFGLAKIMEGEGDGPVTAGLAAPGSTALTDAGKVMGTPQYMSPEQKENPGEVDHRADIYALGVVFYQMLTGELPGKKLEPPSRKVSIDVRLDEIVLRALEKQPELRFQQASVLKTQVETIVAEGERPEPEKNEIESRFSRTAIIGAGLVILAVLFWAGAYFVDGLSEAGLGDIYHNMTALELASKGLAVLGTLCLLSSSIFGWIAVSQIRHSAGKICGLGLAVFDGLLFPLLALDTVVWFFTGLILMFFHLKLHLSGTFVVLLVPLIGIPVIAILDFYIIRHVWHAVGEPDDSKIPPAIEAWLALMDKGDYTGTWQTAAPMFRSMVSEEVWAGKCVKIRKPLGKVISRELKSSGPGALGKLFKAKFTTRFDGGFDATETVTFSRQADGSWKAFSYSVRIGSELARDWRRAFWIVFVVMMFVLVLTTGIDLAINLFTSRGMHGLSSKVISGSAAENVEKLVSPEVDNTLLALQPPVVVATFPISGARDIEPGETDIHVRFSKPMMDGSWTWSTAWENSTPELLGDPHYENEGRTCAVKVKLEAGKTYAFWLNSDKFSNFKDAAGHPAVPYLLIFSTKQK